MDLTSSILDTPLFVLESKHSKDLPALLRLSTHHHRYQDGKVEANSHYFLGDPARKALCSIGLARVRLWLDLGEHNCDEDLVP
jgi:hypothetical protein